MKPIMTETLPEPGNRRRVHVANVADLPPGARTIVEVDGRSIGLFNVNGQYRAILNLCPHAFAPICLGPVRGTTRPTAQPGDYTWVSEGEIIACPWHGWEFSLLTGESMVDKRRLRLFPVEVEGERLYVIIGRGSP